MRRLNTLGQALPFIVGAVATAFLYLLLAQLGTNSPVRSFLFRSWYVQAVTTWLFATTMAFMALRFRRLAEERRILATKVTVDRLDTITHQRARDLLDVVPAQYRGSIGFRRIHELLHGYLHGGDVILLNQELSRRDIEQVESGHLVLNALRQLIPVLGFLGTVVGLSLGMIQFPEISNSGQNIETLRSILKNFAASLSIAFDTTLLALGYSVVVVLIASVLRHTEESFVSEVDEKARQLTARLQPAGSGAALAGDTGGAGLQELAAQFQLRLDEVVNEELKRWLAVWQTEVIDAMKGSLERVSAHNGDYARQVQEGLRNNGDALLQKLDELKVALHGTRSYEVTVQPAGGQRCG